MANPRITRSELKPSRLNKALVTVFTPTFAIPSVGSHVVEPLIGIQTIQTVLVRELIRSRMPSQDERLSFDNERASSTSPGVETGVG